MSTKEQAPLLTKETELQEDPILEAAKKRALEPPLNARESLDHLRTNFEIQKLMQLNFKKTQLAAIKRILKKYQAEFFLSQVEEYNSEPHVSYMQLSLVYNAVDHILENLNEWAADRHVNSVLAYFPATNYVKKQGKGVFCIFGSYKFSLSSTLLPMLYAIASGNCCLIKPSYECPKTVNFLKKIAEEAFDPRFYKLIEGGVEVDNELAGLNFDGFYYTGNNENGRSLLGSAGKNLVPCSVDMETKCPIVIGKDANLKHAVRVIASNVFYNGGFMPHNPDYCLVDSSVYPEFKKLLVESVMGLWRGNTIGANWPTVLNEKFYNRLVDLTKNLEDNVVLQMQKPEMSEKFFPPTILENVSEKSEIMNQVVNGPILCQNQFKIYDECVEMINNRELSGASAIYVFSNCQSGLVTVLKNETRSGTIIMNDLWMPFLNAKMPAEGAGDSGWGAHTGFKCFEDMSQNRAVCEKANTRFLDAEDRYPNPSVSSDKKLALAKKLGKFAYLEPWHYWLKIRFFVYVVLAYLLWKCGFWTLTFPMFEKS